jgi:hypothetical protein
MIERLPQPDQRRLFFRYLARETVVWFEELLGKPNMQLSDLPKLPPEAIAALIPRVCPGVEIIPEEGQVSARLPGASESVVLFPNEEANLLVFNRFNGENTLGQVAGELGAALAWPRERSFAHVKELFFRLVRLKVCLPANTAPPEAGVS